jgi:hypothetical protein
MGKRLKPFSLKSGMRQGCPFSPLLLNIVLEFLARAIRKEEKIKGIQTGKKKSNYLFTDDMILYLKEPKKLHQKLSNTINSFNTVAGCKINLQKSVAFLYTNNEQIEKKYMKTIPLTIASKSQTPRNKQERM